MLIKSEWIVLMLLPLCFAGCAPIQRGDGGHSIVAAKQRPKHVILLGFDAMGSFGIQRANTPNLNWIMAHGSGSLSARSVRPSVSSPNWMSMLTGAEPEMHGVTSNDWMPGGIEEITPAVKNKVGLYPTVLELFKQRYPDKKLYAYYEWSGQDRMYDMGLVDKAVTGKTGEVLMRMATEDFFRDRPDFLYVSILEIDDVGHAKTHESDEYLGCIAKYDALIGEFIKKLRTMGLDKESVVIITADHGGLEGSHGGDNVAETSIPLLLYGQGVTPGKMLSYAPSITDVAGTLAELTGTPLDGSAAGRFLAECFTPLGDQGGSFTPSMPRVQPYKGRFDHPVALTITQDNDSTVSLYYTTDGLPPTAQSARYTGPITVDSSMLIRAVAIGPQGESMESTADIRICRPSDQACVRFQKYANYRGKQVPDFSRLGAPTTTGYVHEFSLDEIVQGGEDHFAVRLTAGLQVASAGRYMLALRADDGAKLYLDGKLLIDNDGSHSPITKKAWCDLKEGQHTLEVGYFEDYMGEHLSVYIALPGRGLQTLPMRMMSRPE